MSLNMYLGEVQSQTQSMNAVCTATIQGMEQAIQSIDAFAIDIVLQGILYLCEELIHQNNAFPNDFQSQVAQADVIEYKNEMPDFSALSKGEVEIEMTPTREGPSGNYRKADEALAKKLSTPEMTITRTDIQRWRMTILGMSLIIVRQYN